MREHIIINNDRTVSVPTSVTKIGNRFEHNVNKVTFDCPRYADYEQTIDLSSMKIYINYIRPDKKPLSSLAENVTIDEADPTIMHFDFNITRTVTLVDGVLDCLVCIKSTNSEGVEEHHWNSDIFSKLTVGKGMENEETIAEENIDLITQLLVNLDTTNAEVSNVGERIDELDGKVGVLGTLATEDKSSVVAAVNEVKEASDELKSDLGNLGYKNLADVETIDGEYIVAGISGGIASMGGFKRTGYIPLLPALKKIIFLNTFHYGADGLAFYNDEMIFLKGYSDNTKRGTYQIVDIPVNAAYFAVSGFSSDTLKVYYYGIIENFANTIDSLQSKYVTNKLLANISNLKPNNTGSFVDGKFIQTHNGSGNTWWTIAFKASSTSKNMVRVIANITELSGSVKPHLFGTINGVSNSIISVYKIISEIGLYSFDLDLNYFVVYHNLDLSKNLYIGFANSSVELRCVYDQIDIYSIDTELDTSKTLVENLDEMKNEIESNKNTISSIKSFGEMTSPNGTKFILQISDSGEFVAVPKLPSKILYIGNSLLVGFGFGMAASNSSEDYYYKVNSYLEGKGKTLTKDKISGTGYEGTTSESEQDEWLTNTLSSHLNNELELVIIQLGDNVNTDERISALENGSKKLIRYIRQNAIKARVAWVAEWYSNSTKQTYISNACAECGATFIDISDLPNVSGNKANVGDVITRDDGTTFTIDNTGVASHPSSQGMTAIANRIIEALFE